MSTPLNSQQSTSVIDCVSEVISIVASSLSASGQRVQGHLQLSISSFFRHCRVTPIKKRRFVCLFLLEFLEDVSERMTQIIRTIDSCLIIYSSVFLLLFDLHVITVFDLSSSIRVINNILHFHSLPSPELSQSTLTRRLISEPAPVANTSSRWAT